MPRYQIRFCDSKGNGYFEYVDVRSKKGVEKIAADRATEVITKEAHRYRTTGGPFGMFIQAPKPKRIVHVWEWDAGKRCPKKGGHRFKLQLGYLQATYSDGSKERKEWYEPVIETKTTK